MMAGEQVRMKKFLEGEKMEKEKQQARRAEEAAVEEGGE